MIIAGGAGKNEVKFFENNIDYGNTFKTLGGIDMDRAILSIDSSKNENVAFGLADGRIYVVQVKADGELDTYPGG